MSKHYGKTQTEELADETMQCREIVKEIINFGINQNQILKTIELLALNLEDHNKVKYVVNVIKELQNNKIHNSDENDGKLTKDING